jgi:anti-sigma regulatory factor (Ser/Thr protein kinase)
LVPDDHSQSEEEMRVRLPRAADAPSEARGLVEQELRRRGVEGAVVERAKLVASELVSNAFKHGRGKIELRMSFPAECLRLEVIDEGTDTVPRIRERPGDETGGWGLRIIDRLARQWGVFEGTTHVWADLAREDD